MPSRSNVDSEIAIERARLCAVPTPCEPVSGAESRAESALDVDAERALRQTCELVQLSDPHLPLLGGGRSEVAQGSESRLEAQGREGGVAQLVGVRDHAPRGLRAGGHPAAGRDSRRGLSIDAVRQLRH